MASNALGPSVPRRGNWFTRLLGRGLLRLMGWKLDIDRLPDTPKGVIVAVPHTSNMDGLIFLAGLFATGIDSHWMGKDSLFNKPWGGLLKLMGGLPIDRSQRRGVVEQVVARFDAAEQLFVTVAIEGTRGRAGKWKTGFYHIAHQAGVPVLLGYMDYRTKLFGFGPPVQPSGDIDGDLRKMLDFYREITPRFPDKFDPDAAL